MNNWFYFLPALTTLFGWLIANFLSAYLLKNYLPRKRTQIVRGISQFAVKQLGNLDDLVISLSHPSHVEKAMPGIEEHMDDFLRNRLKKEMPVVGMFIGDKTIDSLKVTFLTEIRKMLPAVIEKYAASATSGIKLEQVISDRLNNENGQSISNMIRNTVPHLLKSIGLAGAIIGFFCGLVQILITLLLFAL